MRDKREPIPRAVGLILAVAGLIICTAAFSTSSGLASAQADAPSWSYTSSLNTATLRANGKIAFTSDRDGNREIYVMNQDGTDQVRLTNNTIVDDHPTWSPDGLKIAFVGERTTGGRAIFTMNPDGTDRTEVTPVSYVDRYVNWPAWIWTDFYSMDWSPDGRQIVFQDNYDIAIVNADGSNRRTITDGTAYDLEPAWSPNGSKIVFSRDPLDDGGLLYGRLSTMNIDGSNIQFLPNAFTGQEYAPKWSPLGDKILFVIEFTDDIPDSVIFITNADGSNDQLFDGNSGGYEYRNKPSWSPDGRKILFDKWAYEPGFLGDLEIYVKKIDGAGSERLTNTSGWNFNPSWQPLAPAACPNPIDCADFFVRQHYLDFLNREPDAPGLAHWVGEINSCNDPSRWLPGESLPVCFERKRTDTSAAFFLSPEFQYTGYFVYRVYKGSLIKNGAGRAPTYQEFLRDVRQVASGIIQNNQLSAAAIEQNKKTFAEEFTRRAEFRSLYEPLSNFDYVDRLFQTTGVSVSATEKQALVDGLDSQTETRASVLRKVVDGTVVIAEGNDQFTTRYGQAFHEKEFNAAFVQMEYFGYLQRDPDTAGYQHWLDKLNFYGNYVDAEMVRSFIASPEYRARFSQR